MLTFNAKYMFNFLSYIEFVFINGNSGCHHLCNNDLYHPTNRQSVKVMVSAALTWYGVTKPIFVNRKGLKKNYKNHFKNGATSHTSNLVQDFLQETIPRRYVKKINCHLTLRTGIL